MRQFFDQSLKVDRGSRERLLTMFEKEKKEGVWMDEEKKIVKEGVEYFGMFAKQKSKDVYLVSPLTKARMASKKGDTPAWGWSKTVVRARQAQAKRGQQGTARL